MTETPAGDVSTQEHPDRPDVFLSYKSEEASRARPIAEALQRVGLSVWWDRRITVGGTWAQEIERAIEESKSVVVLWTEMSVDSDWVHKEARKGEGKDTLVPARLDEVDPPFEFEHVQAANLIGWDGVSPHEGFNDLVSAIQSLIGREVDRPPVPAPRRAGRRRLRSAALLLAAALTATGAVGLGRAPAASTELYLEDLELEGLTFTVSESTSMMPMEVTSLLVSPGDLELSSVSIRPESGQTERIENIPWVFVSADGGGGTISLTGLEYAVDSLFQFERTPTELRFTPPNLGSWEVVLTGDVAIATPEGTGEVAFGRRGTVSFTEESGVYFDLPLDAGQEGVELFSRADISDLELFTVAAAGDDPVPTIVDGRLVADWRESDSPLAGQRLGFDAFEGATASLELQDGVVKTSITGYAVQGIRLGGNDIMPSNWASLGPVRQILFGVVLFVLVGALVAGAGLSFRKVSV